MAGIYRVFVIDLTGKQRQIYSSNSETEFKATKIQEIRKKILENIGYLPGGGSDDFRLVFRNAILEDERTFADYEITHMSILHLIPQLSGGGSLKH
ncbi:uncharacterized protein LOC127571849 [Pristis pectinata]|uniref:uncharacterized protein LOC127571849 n=1 Tax=Pristis pectinata TaxID=685728 RepID=UPI00223E198A|nr:uncharacterized protein LOC127571849 [Pristis pectinata]